MKTVTSKDNPVLKAARKLHTRKGREEAGAFLIEGSKLISEAVSAGFAVEYIFINAGALERGEADTGNYANEIALDEKLFRELAGTVTPQPYMAVVRRPEAGRGLLRAVGSRNDGKVAGDDGKVAGYDGIDGCDDGKVAGYDGKVAGYDGKVGGDDGIDGRDDGKVAGYDGKVGGDDGICEIALDEKLFRELAGTVTPQPYMAVVRRPEAGRGLLRAAGSRNDVKVAGDGGTSTRNDGPAIRNDGIEAGSGEGGGSVRILVLDRIGDPGNVGTMIRSALAAGMDGVWCLKGTADVFSDKAIRASAGAIFRLPALEGLSAKDCIGLAAEKGLRLLVCSAGGTDLYETELTGSIALVIGNEGAGPQEALLAAADAVVGIPMAAGAESLNAAAAAAVVMYEARRQWIASSRWLSQ